MSERNLHDEENTATTGIRAGSIIQPILKTGDS
jgi:hypothetical protein